jgi:formylglycine-generating enzyme required for sulfatase activity
MLFGVLIGVVVLGAAGARAQSTNTVTLDGFEYYNGPRPLNCVMTPTATQGVWSVLFTYLGNGTADGTMTVTNLENGDLSGTAMVQGYLYNMAGTISQGFWNFVGWGADASPPITYYACTLSMPRAIGTATYGSETVIFSNLYAGSVYQSNTMGTMTIYLSNGAVTNNVNTLELVKIPAGEFDMGQVGINNGEPVHHVTITKSFYMAKYEITQGQYLQMMGYVPYSSTSPIKPVQDDQFDVYLTFCSNVTALTGGKLRVRIATEAEWEYACRAGTTTVYFWGSSVADAGHYGNFGSSGPEVVGSYLPNAWGLYDMAGNVWDFVNDYYEPYPSAAPVIDPQGPANTGYRITRGGSPKDNALTGGPSAYRNNVALTYDHGVGFRVAVDIVDIPPTVSDDGGASNVAQVSATLNGNLVSTGSAATVVSVYWGTADMGMNAVGWDHVVNLGQCPAGAVSTSVAGLTQGATYYYRFYASNAVGVAWADPAAQFMTVGLPTIDNGSGATSIMPRFARLTGNLTVGGNANIYVCWGTTDGGTTTSSWQHVNSLGVLNQGPFSSDINGLDPNITYSYRCYAVNSAGTDWANSTATFRTPTALFGSWANRMKITFTGYNKSETLTNFPALVVLGTNIANFAYGQFALTDGWDLRFASPDENSELNYEVDQWDTSGQSYVWVQAPRISSSTDYIWAYWGNPAFTSQEACTTNGSTWNSGYRGVWHLNENVTKGLLTGTHYDSTTNANAGGQNYNGVTNGLIGRAQYFDGSIGTYINCSNKPSLGIVGDMTVSAWIKRNTNGDGGIVSKWGNNQVGDWCWQIYGDVSSIWFQGWASSSTAVPVGQWCYMTVSYNSAAQKLYFYLNGAANGTVSQTSNQSGTGANLCIGQRADGYGAWFNGVIDEARVEAVAHSSDWVWACYMNQASNSAFSSYQMQSGTPGGTTVHGIPYSWLASYGITNTSDSVETQHMSGHSLNVLQDYIAGMNPTNANSSFKVGITNSAGQIVVRLPSIQASGSDYSGKTRYYDIELRTNLLIGSWQPVPGYTNIFGNGSIISCTNVTQNQATFYRTKVWLQ